MRSLINVISREGVGGGGVNIYGLLTKYEIKMVGYWPRSFLSVYGLRQSQGS